MTSRRAYTFFELLIVAAIIMLLAAIAVPNFLEARIRASVSRSKADLALLKMGIEAYRLDHRAYPPNAVTGVSSAGDLVVLTTPVAYLPALPHDVLMQSDPKVRGIRPLERPTRRFEYLNLMQVAPGEGLHLAGAPVLLGEGRVAGLIWGGGPVDAAATFPPAGFHEAEDPGRRLAERLVIYDPTNGTASPGVVIYRLP
jgi:competence protein ComGC